MHTCLAAVALVAVSGLAVAEPGMTSRSSTGEPEPAPLAEDGKLAPRTGLPIGYDAPNARVHDDEGEEVELHELIKQAEGPVVLVFYRGGWCPYCTKHLAELQHALPELEEQNATLLAISPESYDKLVVSEEKAESEFTLLSDSTNEASKAFNLIFDLDDRTQSRYRNYGIELESWNASGEWKLPVPAVFVIDADGVIRWRHVDEDYSKRLAPKKLIEAVETVAAG